MARSSMMRRIMRKQERKRKMWAVVRFPRSLKKMIRDGSGEWVRDIHGYHFYPVEERVRRRFNRLPLKYKRHLCLPLPEIQAPELEHCLHHSLIKCLESRVRIARWKLDPRWDTPRLSIQHAIDATAHLDDPDYVYTFLGIDGYVGHDFSIIPGDSIGVTTASNWPYIGPPNPAALPIPNEVKDWERFKLAEVNNYDKRYDHLQPDFEDVIDSLIACLKSHGPFIAWFVVRTSHTDAREICTREGRTTNMTHTVVVTGWKKWEAEDGFGGYWEFLDSYGLGRGRNGFGRISFDAVQGVEVITPSL